MKWGFWLIVTVVVAIVAALIGNAAYVRRAQARLDAAIVPADSPLTIAALERAPLPADQNAALAMGRIAADLEVLKQQLTEVLPENWSDSPGGTLTSAEATELTTLFADQAPLLQSLQVAAACPDSNQLLNHALLPPEFPGEMGESIRGEQTAVEVLAIQGALLRRAGNGDQAATNIATMLRIARHREREPLLINHVVAVTLRGMAFHAAHCLAIGQTAPIVHDGWDSVRAALRESEDHRGYEWALVSQRAYQLEAIQHQASGMARFFQGWRLHQQADRAELAGQLLAALTTSDIGRFKVAVENPSAELQRAASEMEISFHAHCEDLARVRILLCMIAVLQQDDGTREQVVFRKEEPLTKEGEGQSPQAIVLDGDWLDPFDGQPMRVKHTPAGWLIYSVGPDLIDGNGDFSSSLPSFLPKDIGLGPLAIPLEKSP